MICSIQVLPATNSAPYVAVSEVDCFLLYDMIGVLLAKCRQPVTAFPERTSCIKLASKYWKTGLGEIWRSFSKKAFVKALSKLVPEIKTEHLKTAPAGVRAQAVSLDGSMVDDFYFSRNGNILNVCNAPSPAATASLNIAKVITEKIDNG